MSPASQSPSLQSVMSPKYSDDERRPPGTETHGHIRCEKPHTDGPEPDVRNVPRARLTVRSELRGASERASFVR